MEMYSENDIRKLLEICSTDKDIIINSSFDSIMSKIKKEKIEKVFVVDDFSNFTIKHEMFEIFHTKGIMKNFFDGIYTLQQLTEKIISTANNNWEIILEAIDNEYTYEKMLGDLFEIFAELFFKTTQSDNRIGISNYEPVHSSEDFGVDGVGIGFNGKPCTIQVKFRTNPMEELTIKDLKNFQGISYRKYSVDVDDDNNLIIFTNCQGLHWNTESNVLLNSTLTFGNFGDNNDRSLKALLDNNIPFWNNIKSLIKYVIVNNKY